MELVDIITAFIRQPNTDFAILINGAWGSGKTHFLNQTVKQAVEQIPCELAPNKTEHYKLVYTSLYGIDSGDELEKRLFLEVNPVLKKKVFSIAGTVFQKITQVFSVNTDAKDLVNIFGGIPKNRILVFDDLERLQPDVLNQVLGFINAYTEHQKLKVIIVADETRIADQSGSYKNIKEKLIRFTYLYDPKLETVFPHFTAQYQNANYRQYLQANKNLICDFFAKGNHKNLRSLKFLTDLFEPVFETIHGQAAIHPEVKTTLLKRILSFMTTYTIEYKKGQEPKTMTTLEKISQPLNYFALGLDFWDNLIVDGQEINEQPEADPAPFTEIFQETYFKKNKQDFEYIPQLAHYINSGDFNKQQLQEFTTRSQLILDEIDGSLQQTALKKLKSCLVLNDNELIPLVTEILGYADLGQYKLEEYPIIFQNLVELATYGMHGITVDDQTVARFEAGMKLALPNSTYKSNFRNQTSILYNDNPLLKQVRDIASVLNDSLQEVEDKAYARTVVDLLTPGTLTAFHDKLQSNESKAVPIFQPDFIPPQEFLQKFDALNNKQKLELLESLQTYSQSTVRHRNVFAKEIAFYQAIDAEFTARVAAAQQNKMPSTHILESYLWWLKDQVKKLQELNQ